MQSIRAQPMAFPSYGGGMQSFPGSYGAISNLNSAPPMPQSPQQANFMPRSTRGMMSGIGGGFTPGSPQKAPAQQPPQFRPVQQPQQQQQPVMLQPSMHPQSVPAGGGGGGMWPTAFGGASFTVLPGAHGVGAPAAGSNGLGPGGYTVIGGVGTTQPPPQHPLTATFGNNNGQQQQQAIFGAPPPTSNGLGPGGYTVIGGLGAAQPPPQQQPRSPQPHKPQAVFNSNGLGPGGFTVIGGGGGAPFPQAQPPIFGGQPFATQQFGGIINGAQPPFFGGGVGDVGASLNPHAPAGKLAGIGIVFLPHPEKGIVVRKIVPNSPAGMSGRITVGDVLLEIDGRDVRGRPISALQPLIQGPEGSQVTLTLRSLVGRTTNVRLVRHWMPTASELSRYTGTGDPNCPSKISQLCDTLFVGDAVTVRDLNALLQRNIGAVINCTEECANHHQGTLRYKQFMLSDTPHANIRQVFAEACQFIDATARTGKATIVHCAMGKSRSVTVCLAYLVHRGHSLAEACQIVKSKRPWARPNQGFFGQLLAWERARRGSNSLTSESYMSLFPK